MNTNDIPVAVDHLTSNFEVYTSLLTALLVAIAAAGRAWHAIKNDTSVVKALVLGTNTDTPPAPPTPPVKPV